MCVCVGGGGGGGGGGVGGGGDNLRNKCLLPSTHFKIVL